MRRTHNADAPAPVTASGSITLGRPVRRTVQHPGVADGSLPNRLKDAAGTVFGTIVFPDGKVFPSPPGCSSTTFTTAFSSKRLNILGFGAARQEGFAHLAV